MFLSRIQTLSAGSNAPSLVSCVLFPKSNFDCRVELKHVVWLVWATGKC
uniref:Uncharacterized protein n=1 Tax=Utricularia reniformis TaxID=192314 RepID=A0A1Y0B2P4_9LAMI|nr:hypothetical protein AEK19_MT1473 [Utricularia reniformis]ART31664.1 hypothetical protein AEK19_MT1473 [Utricularia reniformis]